MQEPTKPTENKVEITQVHRHHLSEFIKSIVSDNKKFKAKVIDGKNLSPEDEKNIRIITELQNEEYVRGKISELVKDHPKNEHVVITVKGWKELLLDTFSIKRIKSNANRKAEKQRVKDVKFIKEVKESANV